MVTTITQDNVALVTEAVDAIQSHVEALAGAPADARPQMLAAHKAHITMLMQRLRAAHPDLATIAPVLRGRASSNFPQAVVALRESCAAVRAAAVAATETLREAQAEALVAPPVVIVENEPEVVEQVRRQRGGRTRR